MRDKFVTWGTRSNERCLFTFELDAEEMQITRRSIPTSYSTDDLMKQILNAWTNHTTISFPEGTDKQVIPVSSSEPFTEAGVDYEDKGRIESARLQWPKDISSAQMAKQIKGELSEIADLIEDLTEFDARLFDRLKLIWEKVLNERKEENLLHEHVKKIKKINDGLFEKLKGLRREQRKQLSSESKKIKAALRIKLSEAENELEEKKDLPKLFNKLKKIQAEINSAKLDKGDRNVLRKSIDELFKATKSEIESSGAFSEKISKQRTHLENRLQGLEAAIGRMENSIKRDEKDQFYENKRLKNAGNQLAQQLGQAKLLMINERTNSKQEKLNAMLKTKADLDKKLKKIKAREEKALKNKNQQKDHVKVASSSGQDNKNKKSEKKSTDHSLSDVYTFVVNASKAFHQK